MEYYIIQIMINISVNGKIIKEKDMGYFIIHPEVNMKGNGKMI